MNEASKCRQCGAALTADATAGVCPRCLVELAIAFNEQARQSGGASPAEEAGDPSESKPAPTVRPVSVPPADSRSEAQAADQLPRRFGDYELLEQIARGGMGVIFKARQVSLNRIVAVKMILAGQLASKEMVLRFRAEAESAANLHHPNIVAIHETGEIEGQHYFSMDYVAGPDLGRLAREGPVDARRAARYVEKIAQAVHYAHEHGVLHRDLKPSNVLIDDQDEPRVTDFGLAKKFTVDSGLTLSGQLLGSPNFMPPEQASRKRGKVGRYSDVYGLGGLLYHLLTSRPPFQAATLEETLQQVFEREPVSPRALNPNLARDLETICLKCLEKEPARRYPTAQAVADELGRFLRGEPVQARPIGAVGKIWRWCRRKPALAAVGAIAAVLLLTLAIGGPIVAARQRAAAQNYRRLLYSSDLKAAHHFWEQANMRQTVTLLDRHRPVAGQSDLREFTWHYLNQLSRSYRDTPFLDRKIGIFWLAPTRDGKLLAAAGGGGSVTIWNLETMAKLRELNTGEPFMVGPMTFSPDGRYLATAHASEWTCLGLQIWDTATWNSIHHADYSSGRCAFSPDGTRLAVPSGTNVVLLQVGGQWSEVGTLPGITGSIKSVLFSPDGKRLATTGDGDLVCLWDVTPGEALGVFRGGSPVFSPDGKQLATADRDNTVRLWDVDSKAELRRHVNPVRVRALDFSPDGRTLAVGAQDGLVMLWDVETDTIRNLRGHSQTIMAVKFVLGGTKLASASFDGTIKLSDMKETPPNDVLEGGDVRGPSPIAFSRDGPVIATVSSNASSILLWNVASGILQTRLEPGSNFLNSSSPSGTSAESAITLTNWWVDDLAFSPGDSTLAVACRYEAMPSRRQASLQRIELWNVERRAMTAAFEGTEPICFSRDGRIIASQGLARGTIQFRDLATGRAWTNQGSFAVTPEQVALAFSPDGRMLASSGVELVLWEAATGKKLDILVSSSRDTHPPINTLAFTPDGAFLIMAGGSAEIWVFDLAKHRITCELLGHVARIRTLALWPEGPTFASGDALGEIKLWSLEQTASGMAAQQHAQELLSWRAHEGGVYARMALS